MKAGVSQIALQRVPLGNIAARSCADSKDTADARRLIINADDFGLCEEQNQATIRGFEQGILSSASVMVPAPGFADAAAYARRNPQADIGVHLVLTSEWQEPFRWKPVLVDAVPSLSDNEGYMWRTPAEVFANADPREAEAELRAQIEQALEAGIDVTHLDSHMFVLHARSPQFRRIYLQLARDYQLPIRAVNKALLVPRALRFGEGWGLHLARLARRALLLRAGFRRMSEDLGKLGIACPDYLVIAGPPRPQAAHEYWSEVIAQLPAGLTEIYCHPALAQPDRAPGCIRDFADRQGDCDFFSSPAARAVLEKAGVKQIGYRGIQKRLRAQPGIAAMEVRA